MICIRADYQSARIDESEFRSVVFQEAIELLDRLDAYEQRHDAFQRVQARRIVRAGESGAANDLGRNPII